MQLLRRLLNREWWRFQWRYLRKDTPWDTQITPPEVMEFIKQRQPGRALDLGCGTGTNVITLAEHGWRSTGVDFSPKAIAEAREKARHRALDIDFHVADVSDISFIEGPFDYLLDIGCLFTLSPEQQKGYAAEASRLLRADAVYMLYAWLPQQRGGRRIGLSVQEVQALFSTDFLLEKVEYGKDGPGESAWYWLKKLEDPRSGVARGSQ